jgi:uncharacterized protein (DUF305 family)
VALGVLLLAVTLGACTACTAGGADEVSTHPIATETEQVTAADAAWIAGMAEHHDQAVALARLAEGRTADPEVLASAERIAAGQAAEATALRDWLDRRGLDDTAHHGDGDMPGEISASIFARAEAATGDAFDALFLDAMVRHHEGAVQMSEERLAAAGDPAVSRWARTVATGQTVELDRLRALIGRTPPAG